MKNYIKIYLLLILIMPIGAFAQNSVKKATAPKAVIVMLQDGKEIPIERLRYGQENLVKIRVNGGVENINHKIFVTSTNAVVKHVKADEYIIKPVGDDKVNLIVDIQTYEDYFFYQLKPKGKNQKMKKVLTTYPPEKYMVSYESYQVQKL